MTWADSRAAAIDGDHRCVSCGLRCGGVRSAFSPVASLNLDGARHLLPLLLADVHPTLRGLGDSGEPEPEIAHCY